MRRNNRIDIRFGTLPDGTAFEVGSSGGSFWGWKLDRNRNRVREITIPKTVKTIDAAKVYVEGRLRNSGTPPKKASNRRRNRRVRGGATLGDAVGSTGLAKLKNRLLK